MIKSFYYKNIHCSPKKLRSLLFLMKKKNILNVIQQLDFIFNKSAFIFKHIIKNISHNLHVFSIKNNYFINTISVNKGKILKKRNFLAKGKIGIIKKRLSNILITITSEIKV